jgi:hypothetical protein
MPQTGTNKEALSLEQTFCLTPIEMCTSRDLITAARNKCELLAAQKQRPTDALEKQCVDLCQQSLTYTNRENTVDALYSTLLDEDDSTPTAHKLAEKKIYFI